MGSGYTNHCPECLWSKHVDINPGDRSAVCGGLMQPVGLDKKKSSFIIIHECLRCGMHKRNSADSRDNFQKLIALSSTVGE